MVFDTVDYMTGSQYERGRLTSGLKRINLAERLAEIDDSLELTIDGDCPRWIEMSGERFYRLVKNLTRD